MPDVFAFYQFTADHSIAIGSIVFILLLLFVAALFKKLRPWQSYLQSQPILTANEREFYHRLARALPNHPIFPQVAFSALIAVDGQLSGRQQFAIRRRFAWKYADFVICRPYTLDVLLLIELDDRTHDAHQDRQRDAITKAVGYRTLRFQSKHKPSVSELAELFTKLLPTLKAETHYKL